MLKINKQNSRIRFHLSNEKISYVLEVIDKKFIVNRYIGPKLPYFSGSSSLDQGRHAFAVYQKGNDSSWQFSCTNLLYIRVVILCVYEYK